MEIQALLKSKDTTTLRILMLIAMYILLFCLSCYVIGFVVDPKCIIISPEKEKVPMTKEIDDLIKSNSKKLSLESYRKEVLTERLTNFIHENEYWRLGKKEQLSKGYCKKIAKAIVKNTKYPIVTTSIIFAESDFNRNARNPRTGALGLGQIHPIHKDELIQAGIINRKFSELKEIDKNIQAIDFVLQNKMELTDGNMDKALVLYSGNATGYNKKVWGKVSQIRKGIGG